MVFPLVIEVENLFKETGQELPKRGREAFAEMIENEILRETLALTIRLNANGRDTDFISRSADVASRVANFKPYVMEVVLLSYENSEPAEKFRPIWRRIMFKAPPGFKILKQEVIVNGFAGNKILWSEAFPPGVEHSPTVIKRFNGRTDIFRGKLELILLSGFEHDHLIQWVSENWISSQEAVVLE